MSHGPYLILEYKGKDACVIPCSSYWQSGVCVFSKSEFDSDVEISLLNLELLVAEKHRISSGVFDEFMIDYRENKIDFTKVRFKSLDSLGRVREYIEHHLAQK